MQPVLLAVLPSIEDCNSLTDILGHTGWRLSFSHTFPQAREALEADCVRVVVSEGRLADGHCWKDILDCLQQMPRPAPLIVVDRLADVALWAEVLNLGGYDVLAKPFHAREVLHAVTTAWYSSTDRRERRAAAGTPPKSEEPGTAPGQRGRFALGAGHKS